MKSTPLVAADQEVNTKFGGNMVPTAFHTAEQQLPSQSVGKDFGKAKGTAAGKGLRDIDGGQEANDWRSSGPRKGKGKGDGEPSRADAGDWRGGVSIAMRKLSIAAKDDDWRGGMGSRLSGAARAVAKMTTAVAATVGTVVATGEASGIAAAATAQEAATEEEDTLGNS
eukprot:Skav226819  [mRNA]  locus=scaffold606:92027:100563:- [translate_table: standard]